MRPSRSSSLPRRASARGGGSREGGADVVHVATSRRHGRDPALVDQQSGRTWELPGRDPADARPEGLRAPRAPPLDGGLKTGRDVVVAALLGADEVSFGTALLLAEGCLMVGRAISTRARWGSPRSGLSCARSSPATPEHVEAYLVRTWPRHPGGTLRGSVCGASARRSDTSSACGAERSGQANARRAVDPAPLLRRAELGAGGYAGDARPHVLPGGKLGAWIAGAPHSARSKAPSLVELDVPISNSDRTVGAQLGGAIAGLFGAGKPPGRVRVTMTGSAGQSFGAFLSAGVRLDLTGEANDGVGKGMGGGRIVIRPPEGDAGEPTRSATPLSTERREGSSSAPAGPVSASPCATRVRPPSSKASARTVASTSPAGTVVVLGELGRNVAAGCSGGQLLVHDPAERPSRRG